MARFLSFAAFAMMAFAPLALEAQPVVVVLPFGNVSGTPEAVAEAERIVAEQFAKRGWTVAATEDLEPALEQHRIRYLDSLTPETLTVICRDFGASAVVTGSVLAYRENGDPAAALAARMVTANGYVMWADLVATSASESEGVLGFGRRGSAQLLLHEAATQLTRGIPKPSRDGRQVAREIELAGEGAAFGTRPQTYRSSRHPRGQKLRICVLPFASKLPEAGRIMLDILTVRLEATGEFELVEPAEFREAMRKAQIRSVSSMTSTELAVLGAQLGTPLFLRGNVHTWREASGGRSEVQIDMTLVDVAEGTILWAVTHQRRGSDYAGLLGRGTINSIVALADNVISEALKSQHRTRPREHGSNRPVSQAGKER